MIHLTHQSSSLLLTRNSTSVLISCWPYAVHLLVPGLEGPPSAVQDIQAAGGEGTGRQKAVCLLFPSAGVQGGVLNRH